MNTAIAYLPTIRSITPAVMLLLMVYWILKELCKHRVRSPSKLCWVIGHPYCAADFLVTPAAVIVVTIFAKDALTWPTASLGLHLENLTLFLCAITFSQTVRAFSVRTKQFRQFLPSYFNVAHVGLLNLVAAVYVYSCAFTHSSFARAVAWISIIANAARILKYRAYDDFVEHNIDSGKLAFGSFYIVMIFDIVWRSLVALILSFALTCLLLIQDPDLGGAKSDLPGFAIAHPGGNLFFDLTYFAAATLTTVGFGDITPTTSTAKIVTAVFMIVGYVVFATIIGLAVSIAADVRKRDRAVEPSQLGGPGDDAS